MDAHKNFALSTLASPPDGTSGTSLTVATGHGTRFPAAPFNVTLWPAGVASTVSNAEIVRVTAKATDVFTVTRAQEGTSARTHAANDQIAATFTARSATDIEYGAHGIVNVKDPVYGAVGDNSTDDTAAFAAAFASGASHIYVPVGQYRITATVPLPSAGRVIIEGTGLNSRIDFNPTTDGTAMFSSTTGDTFVFRNLNIVLANSGSKTDCTGIDLADADISDMAFENCTFNGWNRYAVKLAGATYVKFDGCRFSGNVAPSGAPAVCIYSTSFINALKVSGTRFLNNDKVLRATNTYAASFDGACSFEGNGDTSVVALDSIIDYAGWAFTFAGNYVENEQPGVGYSFIQLTNCGGASITGSSFVGQFAAATNTERFIWVQGSDGRGVNVSGCRFDSATTHFVKSSTHVVRVNDCSFYQLGTGELTTHNAVMALMSGPVELNNLTTASVVDVGSIAIGASYSSADIAVTGAALGDEVRVSANVDLAGLQLSGYVRAAGQCRFTLVNNTAGAVDLASATYFLRLVRLDV